MALVPCVASRSPPPHAAVTSAAAFLQDVNGTRAQESDIDRLTWNVPDTIAALSACFTLCPGDIIMARLPASYLLLPSFISIIIASCSLASLPPDSATSVCAASGVPLLSVFLTCCWWCKWSSMFCVTRNSNSTYY